jgi:hypothetical protein
MRYLLALCFALVAAPVAAQTVTITDPSTQGTFQWDASPTADRYELDLGSGFVSIGNVTQLKLAANTPDGSYTARLRACLSSAPTPCSAPATVTFIVDRPDATPITPTNFRLVVTVVNGVALLKLEPLTPED